MSNACKARASCHARSQCHLFLRTHQKPPPPPPTKHSRAHPNAPPKRHSSQRVAVCSPRRRVIACCCCSLLFLGSGIGGGDGGARFLSPPAMRSPPPAAAPTPGPPAPEKPEHSRVQMKWLPLRGMWSRVTQVGCFDVQRQCRQVPHVGRRRCSYGVERHAGAAHSNTACQPRLPQPTTPALAHAQR